MSVFVQNGERTLDGAECCLKRSFFFRKVESETLANSQSAAVMRCKITRHAHTRVRSRGEAGSNATSNTEIFLSQRRTSYKKWPTLAGKLWDGCRASSGGVFGAVERKNLWVSGNKTAD